MGPAHMRAGPGLITSQNDTAPKRRNPRRSRRASLITSQNDTAPKRGRSPRRSGTRLITSQNDTAPKRLFVDY